MGNLEIQYYEHLCLCGCGGKIEIKKWHKYIGTPIYIHGHNKVNIGKKMPIQQKKKIAETIKRQYINGRKKASSIFKKGFTPWNKGLTKENNETMKLISEKQKGEEKSESMRKNMSEGGKGKKLSEEHKNKIGKSNRENYTEERKKKISLKNKDKKMTQEQRKNISESKKGDKNPMYGKYGELNPNWNNGSSFKPYAPEFNKKLKQSILERDNYTCQCPDCEHKSNKLVIHHIDFNKQNNNPENLIALCNSCHGKTFGKDRQYFTEFYQNIMNKKLIDILI